MREVAGPAAYRSLTCSQAPWSSSPSPWAGLPISCHVGSPTVTRSARTGARIVTRRSCGCSPVARRRTRGDAAAAPVLGPIARRRGNRITVTVRDHYAIRAGAGSRQHRPDGAAPGRGPAGPGPTQPGRRRAHLLGDRRPARGALVDGGARHHPARARRRRRSCSRPGAGPPPAARAARAARPDRGARPSAGSPRNAVRRRPPEVPLPAPRSDAVAEAIVWVRPPDPPTRVRARGRPAVVGRARTTAPGRPVPVPRPTYMLKPVVRRAEPAPLESDPDVRDRRHHLPAASADRPTRARAGQSVPFSPPPRLGPGRSSTPGPTTSTCSWRGAGPPTADAVLGFSPTDAPVIRSRTRRC